MRGNWPCGKGAWRGGLRVSSRGGGRVTGYYIPRCQSSCQPSSCLQTRAWSGYLPERRALSSIPRSGSWRFAFRPSASGVGRPRRPEGERGGERGGPMRAGVSGSLSHQASDGPLLCGDGGRAPKLGADAEFLQAWWRRTAAERAATDCVAATPSAGGAIARAVLRWARPFRGAQLPAACSLACAAFEYELRRSGREFAWGAGTREQGLREGKVGMAARSARRVSGAKGVDSWGRERRGAATLVPCARACVCRSPWATAWRSDSRSRRR